MPAAGGERGIFLRLKPKQNFLNRLERQQERAGVLALFNAIDRPQAEHEILARAFAQRDEFGLGQNLALVHHALDIALQIGLDGKSPPGEVRGRARAEAQILVADPVFHVVAADEAVVREIGDLVLVIAELLQRFNGVEIHIRLCVVVREIGAVLV